MPEKPPASENDTEQREDSDARVGKFAVWETNGTLRFKEPKQIRRIEEDPKSKQKFAFFDEFPTGIPLDELVFEKSAEELESEEKTKNTKGRGGAYYSVDAERGRYNAKKEKLYQELNRIAKEVREMPIAGEPHEEGYDPEAKARAEAELDRLGFGGRLEKADNLQEPKGADAEQHQGLNEATEEEPEEDGGTRSGPLNPFAGTKEQPLTKGEIRAEKFLLAIERQYVKIKNFLLFRYKPKDEAVLRRQCETLVKAGQAEFVGTMRIPSEEDMRVTPKKTKRFKKVDHYESHTEGHDEKKKDDEWYEEEEETKHEKYKPSYAEYRRIRHIYEGHQELYFTYKAVGVYDEIGEFTGKMRLYKIFRGPKHSNA